MICNKFKKAIASLLIVALLAPNLVHVDFSYSEEKIAQHDLIVLLVEKSLFKTGDENKSDTLTGKIYRYAEDIRTNLSDTKVKLVLVDDKKHPVEIRNLLEEYYLEGEKIANEVNQLAGVVLVGEIPFSVVRYKDYFIPTVYPYTDFIDPAYIWDKKTSQFIQNWRVFSPKPEIWHGIIRAPHVDKYEAELGAFFDKNHAFYSGSSDYANFDSQIFYADTIQEDKNINPKVLENYFLRNEYKDDLVYMRYNKYFADTLAGKIGKNQFPALGVDDDGDGLIDEDPPNYVDDDGDGKIDEDMGDIFKLIDNDLDGLVDEDEYDNVDNDGDGAVDEDPSKSPFLDVTFDKVHDIYMKYYIDNFLINYAKVAQQYLRSLHDLVENSGRWQIDNIDSFPGMITKLDAGFDQATKEVNHYFENLLDEQIENQWQKDLRLIESLEIEDTSAMSLSGVPPTILLTNIYNGRQVNTMTKPEDCTIYRGTSNADTGNFAVQTGYNRLFNPYSAGDPKVECLPYGDCCANYYQSPGKCVPDNAIQSIYDSSVGMENDGVATAEACKKSNFYASGTKHNVTFSTIVNVFTDKIFSSVFKHIEPTAESIMNAVKSDISISLPADNPRRITFQDQGDQNIEIDYFNFFDIKNITSKNDIETIKQQIKEKLDLYDNSVKEKITKQNLDAFEAYLYRFYSEYIISSGEDTAGASGTSGSAQNKTGNTAEVPILGITYPSGFENKFAAWEKDILELLAEKYQLENGLSALTLYLDDLEKNYEKDLNKIFQNHFSGLSGQGYTEVTFSNPQSFREFVLGDGGTVKISKEVFISPPKVIQYSFQEVSEGVKKYIKNSSSVLPKEQFDAKDIESSGEGSAAAAETKKVILVIELTLSYPTVKNLPQNYWIDQYRQFGEDFIAMLIQWNNANVDEKHQLIFEGAHLDIKV